MVLLPHLLKWRLTALILLAFLTAASLAARLAYVQLYHGERYQEQALNQRMQGIPVDPRRGTLFDRNGLPLAVSISASSVYALPREIEDTVETAARLAAILGIEPDTLQRRLERTTAVEWVQKQVTSDQSAAILALKLPGIGVVENPVRVYPYGSTAPQVLGFVGIDNQGLEGLELYYDDVLRGELGSHYFERDARGQTIPGGLQTYDPGQPGADLILTLDLYLQHIAQQEVERAAWETGARLALLVLTDPLTGEILANACYPSFDLTNYQDYPLSYRRNIAVTDTYEPGSTFKAVTAAIALHEGVASLRTHFFDPGYTRVSGWTIRCWNRGGHGSQTFIETLENSCNPFYAKLGVDLGGERFYDNLIAFNFAAAMGVDFPGEAPGKLRPPSAQVPLVTWANIGFGQGLTMTPLQLLAAFGAIANHGIYSVPHYVKEIRKGEEVLVPETARQQHRVLPVDIAAVTTEALRSVVANGSGRRADAEGYRVAGKTGTAQVVVDGRYSHAKTVTSFAGFAPADEPAMAGLLVLWEPQGAFYGGIIAAPVFERVVQRTMPYLGVEQVLEDAEDSVHPTVPDVEGLTVAEAELVLTQAGFGVIVVGSGSDIIGQVPRPQVRAAPGSDILIYTDVEHIDTTTETPVPFGV